MHGTSHYGFGSLWLKWQRRGDFYREFYAIAAHHGFKDECKWSRASRQQFLPFYEDLIEFFFKRRWMVFHCMIVRKDVVRKELHNNDWDLARRKHYTELLTNKMKLALRRFPNHGHEFRVYVDPMPSRYKKADEAMEVITNHILNQKFKHLSPVSSVRTRDSKDTPSIQLCDLLLGAVMETWQQKTTNQTKIAIRNCIAKHLGWGGLDFDTKPSERKFNIWYFHDPMTEPRKIKSPDVKLLYPYPS